MPVSPNTKRDESSSSNDLYITPKEALDAIWKKIEADIICVPKPFASILEPCMGLGDIAKYVSDNTNNFTSITTNELYPCEDESKLLIKNDYSCDFLDDDSKLSEHKGEFDILVANPPYNKAMEFVLKGFEYAPVQWHFLRLSFLESQKRFEWLFNLGKLSDVYIFTYRVSCDKGYDREETANSVCYAWYRFDNKYFGHPRLHWLTKGV
jgi:hypothetical protein